MLKVLKCVTENINHGHLNILLVLYINITSVNICMYIKDNKGKMIEIHFTGNVTSPSTCSGATEAVVQGTEAQAVSATATVLGARKKG